MDKIYLDGCFYAAALIGVTAGFIIAVIAIAYSLKGDGENVQNRKNGKS